MELLKIRLKRSWQNDRHGRYQKQANQFHLHQQEQYDAISLFNCDALSIYVKFNKEGNWIHFMQICISNECGNHWNTRTLWHLVVFRWRRLCPQKYLCIMQSVPSHVCSCWRFPTDEVSRWGVNTWVGKMLARGWCRCFYTFIDSYFHTVILPSVHPRLY